MAFENLTVWQKARVLAIDTYKIFGKLRDFGFRNQICRAAISVSNNIAEGSDRGSDKQFAYFLRVSQGSCSEVKSMLYIAQDLDYIDEEDKEHLIGQDTEISRMIFGLISKIKESQGTS